MRYAGATGQLTICADSGFYNHDIVAVCRKMRVRYSITLAPPCESGSDWNVMGPRAITTATYQSVCCRGPSTDS